MSDDFTIHSDPEQSWLEVTVEDMAELDMGPTQMNCSSKREGESIYLSEDPDAHEFVYRYICEKKKPIKYTFIEYESEAYIRYLPSLKKLDS